MTKPYLIGIAGGSGSGKTSILNKLKTYFLEDELTIISMDNYYKPIQKQKKDEHGVVNFDKPSSINQKTMIKDLNLLLDGQKIEVVEYTFNNRNITPSKLIFQPAKIIIVEGLFVFRFKKLRELLDLKVFIHAEDIHKVIRRIKRDRIERNYPLEDVLYRYETHVWPSYHKNIAPYIEKADLIIVNNKSYDKGVEILKSFIIQKLNEKKHVNSQ